MERKIILNHIRSICLILKEGLEITTKMLSISGTNSLKNNRKLLRAVIYNQFIFSVSNVTVALNLGLHNYDNAKAIRNR